MRSKAITVMMVIALGLGLTLTLMGCENDNDSDRRVVKVLGGTFVISTRGGTGQTGPGGIGNAIQIISSNGKTSVLGNGPVDTSFSMPVVPPSNLGAAPWTAVASQAVPVYVNQAAADADAGLPVGGHFLVLTDTLLRRKAAVDVVITGLAVNPGVVLTFGLNLSGFGATGQDTVSMSFANDVAIAGTLVTADLATGTLGGGVIETIEALPATARDRGGLLISANRIYLSGALVTAGVDAATANTRGGWGGQVMLNAADSVYLGGTIDVSGGDGTGTGNGGLAGWTGGGSAVLLSGANLIDNAATVWANGGTGQNGGAGAAILLPSNHFVFNTGALIASGGAGRNGNGGNAGAQVLLNSGANGVYNRGPIFAGGGNATTTVGPVTAGQGGMVQMIGPFTVINTGNVDAQGGSAAFNGVGGPGAGAVFNSIARLVNTGNINVSGGQSAGAALPGGPAGTINLIGGPGGDVTIMGSLLAQGGGGAIGSPGAPITVAGKDVTMIGYNGLESSGGSGTIGAPAGNIIFNAAAATGGDVDFQTPLTIAANGGNATNGPGGDSFPLTMNATGNLTVRGDLILNGGIGVNGPGGRSGALIWTVPLPTGSISFKGNVHAAGGNATGAGNFPGAGPNGPTVIQANEIDLEGTLFMPAGNGIGTAPGGNAGIPIAITAQDHIIADIDVVLTGGNASLTTGTGGQGGVLVLQSLSNATAFAGSYDVHGGHAFTNGLNGQVNIDGVIVFP